MTTLTTNYLTPTGREEAWRFTPLKRLGGLHDGTAVIADRHSLTLGSGNVAGVSFALVSASNAAPISKSDDVIVLCGGNAKANGIDETLGIREMVVGRGEEKELFRFRK